MTELAPTPEIGFVLPQVNTGQQWRTDEYIVGNFQKADAAFIADRARMLKLEGLLRGNTAARDAFWGVPAANAGARVTFANRYPTWFNTDKGWEEQYFAKFDDGGAATTPVKDNFGWAPSLGQGRVLLTRYAAAAVGGGTVTRKGGKTEFAGVQSVSADNVFTADFERYELELYVSAVSVAGAMTMQFRAAAVTDVTNNYAWSFREIATPTETAVGPDTNMTVCRAWTGGFILRSVIDNPVNAGRKTMMLNHMFDTDTKTRIGGSQYNANKAFDGFLLDVSSTATWTGEFRVYGIVS